MLRPCCLPQVSLKSFVGALHAVPALFAVAIADVIRRIRAYFAYKMSQT
jgi:hypothetical protein